MEPATYGFIGTLIGAIVGASASVATTFINTWNTSRLQIKADYLQRIERSRAFQRDTLLSIQEALQDAMRNIVEMHHQDVMTNRVTGEWQKSLLGEELNQKVLSVNRKLSLLVERVSNNELREHIKTYQLLLTECWFTDSEDHAFLKVKKAGDAFAPLMENIGRILRENY